MLRTLTTIGILIAIALPLIDAALFRPGRKSLGNRRLVRIERLVYLLFLFAVLLQAISSFGSIVLGHHIFSQDSTDADTHTVDSWRTWLTSLPV